MISINGMPLNQQLFKNYCSFVCIHLCIFINLSAQSRSFGGLPILSPKKQIQYQSNLNHLPEYSHVYGIYEKLVEAKGDRRMPVPQLNLRSEEAYVASMDYRLMEISIEKKAYDVAAKHGDAAIAFLLAHELVHYYEKHGWRSQYADAVSDLKTGSVLRSLDDRVTNEVQADVLGGFLAYSAGFGIFDKGGLLINDLYKSYKMGENLIGYPSRTDRIALSERNQTQIAQLSNIFEMAGLLTVVGKYKEAYAYYGYLLNKYQSRELYNNAGLTCMMFASSLIDPKDIIFDMPGIMDLEFSGDSRSASKIDLINVLIEEALNHFETAIIMNKKYLASYINKASANIIKAVNQTDPELRNVALNKANHIIEYELAEIKKLHPELDFKSFNDEILILKSILKYFQNDRPTALKLMTEASNAGNAVATKNLSLMKGNPISATTSEIHPKLMIDTMNAEKFLASGLVSRNQTKIDDLNIFRVTDQKSKKYKVLTHEYKGSDQDIGYDLGFVISKKSLSTTFMDGLSIGSLKTDVTKVLGNPKRSLSHLKGEILYYGGGLIVITDHEEKVEKVIDFKEILKP
jgi:tetratricopeptide (TPR) repeat protein